MRRLSTAGQHLSAEQVMGRMKETPGFSRVQKWLVIYNLLVDPRPLKEIAKHVGLAGQTVRNLVSSYNRLGPEAIEGPGRGGRRRSYMSLEEEKAFLEPFLVQARTGQAVSSSEIKSAWEERLGQEVHKTTLYRLLARHGWPNAARRSLRGNPRKRAVGRSEAANRK